MTNEGQKYKYSGRNIRNFGQLLNSFHFHLWHHSCEQEKVIKKTPSPCLSLSRKYSLWKSAA